MESTSISNDLGNIQYEPLIVPCRHSKSRSKVINYILRWLVCWPDPYESSIWPILWAVYGIILIFVDMGSDLWVAKTHFNEGHSIWASLTIAFFLLPIVFALGYTVLIRRFHKWYQVHPVGPLYWSVKIINANRRQRNYSVVRTPDDATSFLHYTHETSRCDYRSRYSSAEESYLESFPESILQAYFIARLWSNATAAHMIESEVTWNMWLSVVISAVSLVAFESTVAYNRHYASAVFEPSIFDIYVRIGLDLMCVFPRLATIACFFTVEPKTVTVTCFIAIHLIVVYLWMNFSDSSKTPSELEEETQSPYEEFRGYKKNRSKLINHLRATVVTFLFPPTCSWHLHDVPKDDMPALRRPSSLREMRRGMPRQFWVISGFQLVESCILFGVWLALNKEYTLALYQIVVPTVALVLLLVRPISDVLVQMLFLTPISQDEATNCIRFRGVVAKARILELGSDIVNSLAAELLPLLHNMDLLLQEPFTDRSRKEVKRDSDFIATNFTPQSIIHRQRLLRRHAREPESNKVATSSGPKTETLLHEVGHLDMELLARVVSSAERWQSLHITADECAAQLRPLLQQCRDRITAWEEVFVLCLNHQPLPAQFFNERDTHLSDTIYADYSKLIALNKMAQTNSVS